MPRPALLLTCALALVTALALLAAATILPAAPPLALHDPTETAPPLALHDPAETATREAAVRFYDAANAALATGDASALTAVLEPGFVDHRPAPGTGGDGAGLTRSLAALRATAPGARLEVEALAADGDRAMAVVAVRGAEAAGFLGGPVAAGPALWPPVDVLRVTGGRVAERRAAGDVGLLEPLARLPLGEGLSARPVVALERLLLPPGGRSSGGGEGEALVVHAATGGFALAVDPQSPGAAWLGPAAGGVGRAEVIGPGAVATLAPDRAAVLPAAAQFELRNEGQALATAFLLTVFDRDAPGRVSPSADPPSPREAADGVGESLFSGRVGAWPAAGGQRVALPAGSAASVGRVALSPGTVAVLAPLAGLTLLWVEAGALEVATGGERAWIRRGDTGASAEATRGLLAAGDGALVPSGGGLTLHNAGDGPVVVLAWTVGPDRSTARPSAAAHTAITHFAHGLDKLGLSSRPEVAAWAGRHALA